MEYELMEEIQSVTSDCMLEHKLTPDQLGQLRSQTTSDDSPTLKPTENLQVYSQENVPYPKRPQTLLGSSPPFSMLQCFAQCILEKARLIVHPNGVQDERFIRVGVLHGKDETRMRTKLRTCRSIYNAQLTCAAAWDLYVCLTQ